MPDCLNCDQPILRDPNNDELYEEKLYDYNGKLKTVTKVFRAYKHVDQIAFGDLCGYLAPGKGAAPKDGELTND